MSQPVVVSQNQVPWYRLLNGYHWFVFTVCTLGWLFDCLDQQLFNASRKPAMIELLRTDPSDPQVDAWATYSTSLLLAGWATGGILFGILGDRIGRARTMIMTILCYSLFTGLTAFAVSVYDFILYRFLCGLGVGGQFGLGVSLVAEALPDKARPPALGMLQAFSAFGNIGAALIAMLFEHMAATGVITGSAWRWIFAIGIVPALLAVIVMLKLEEPQRWKQAVAEGPGKQKAGSIRELFGDPRWRRNTICGMLLATAGVIGLWGIGVFSNDLTHTVFLRSAENEARQAGEAEKDQQFLALLVEHPELAPPKEKLPEAAMILGFQADDLDARLLYAAARTLIEQGQTVSVEAVLKLLDEPAPPTPVSSLDRLMPRRPAQSPQDRARREKFLRHGREAAAKANLDPKTFLPEHAQYIVERFKKINGQVGFWRSMNLMFFNIGAFFGIYSFSWVTQRISRRTTFALFFLLAIFSTAAAFLLMSEPWHLFLLVPLMGFAQLSVFGGYAIYFPELFPTRLRSTGTSFCYNIARFVAVPGPAILGILTAGVFKDYPEPMRYAGVAMCVCFLVGLLTLPFAPETKDQPLPE